MEPYLGEIRMFSGNYAPKGWLFCHGQLLSINNNDGGALFSLLGTAYGGDGIRTFALPDLRGRAPVSQGQSVEGREFRLGDLGGAETVTLNRNEMPVHTHAPQMNANPGTSPTPANNVWAAAAVALQRPAAGRGPGLSRAQSGGRQSTARQHAAISSRQFHHCCLGHLPRVAVIRKARVGTQTFVRRLGGRSKNHVRCNLR